MKLARKLINLFATQPAPRPPAVAPAPLLLALEPRIVYEASLGAAPAAHPAAATSHHHADPAFEAHSNPVPGEGKTPGSASSDTPSRDASASSRSGYRDNTDAAQRTAAASTVSAASATPENQVVFVDPNVSNYQELVSGLPAGTTYVVLNPTTDGLAQIAQYLEQHPGVEAIHLITHGGEAQVQVGATVLTSADMASYSAELAAIGKAMAPGGDFLIYGCDVAAGSDGRALVQEIASATHLNVAASTDATGAATLGGDWTLEYQVGDVKTPVVFSQATEQGYGYLLADTTETFTSTTATSMIANGVTSLTFSLDGITYTITTSDGQRVQSNVVQDGALTGLSDENPSENALSIDSPDIGTVTSIKITMTDGHPFTIQSLDLDGLATSTIGILPNGQSSGSVHVGDTSGGFGSFVGTVVLNGDGSGNPAFADVTSITIRDDAAAGTQSLSAIIGHVVYTELSANLATSGGATTFTSHDSSTGTAVAVDPNLTFTNTEASTARSATIAISGNDHPGEDVLAFANTSSLLYGDITSSGFNAGTGTLTLTSASGTATTADWANALKAVTYVDTAAQPNTSQRTVTFTINDGLSTASATKTIAVDSPPIVTTTGTTTTYADGTSAVNVDAGVAVSDPSQGTQSSATVWVSGGFESGDTLSFTPASGISGAYDSGTGWLTLTSSGGATNAAWAAALESVKFSSTSTVYGNRTISFAVNDGSANSVAATKTLDVIDPHPVITTDAGSAAFVAGDNAISVPVAVDPGLALTEPTIASVSQAVVQIAGNFTPGEDVLSFINTSGATFGNIGVSAYNPTTGVLTLVSSGNSASIAQWRAALEAVTFTDSAVTPNNATRTIGFTVTDTNGNTSNTASRTVTVADTDQTPIISTSGGTTAYMATTSAVIVDGGVAVTDLDNVTLAQGTVSITTGFASGDSLSFTNDGSGAFGNIQAQAYDPATGVLTLTSAGSVATLGQWQAALDAVQFGSTSTSYVNRTISFTVNDGMKNSAAATKTVSVANPDPVITASGSTTFVAGDNFISPPTLIDPSLTLTDPTGATISQATVQIASGLAAGEDVLSFTNTDSARYGNIAGSSYNAATGTLTLTSAGSSASLMQWQAALEAVTYADTAVTPNNATRTISFSVVDTRGNASSPAPYTVTVLDTDQTPIVTTTSGTTTYTAGTTALAVDGGVTVSDLDNTTQSNGTVSITSGYASGDTLSYSNTSSVTFGNIVGSYDAGTGVLTLTSSGALATTAQWRAAFDAVTFSAGTTATPGNRTVSFVVNDGTENSAAATKTVDVLGPPTIKTDTGPAAFVAGDNTASTPVAIDPGLAVSDGIAPTLTSATVSITGNFHAGEDVLAFTNTDASTFGNIVAAPYDPATGTLTLASTGNSATLAQWQAALAAVTYTDTAITPNTATRTISFTVTDIGSNVSGTATRTVTVADTDQTPILSGAGGTTNYVGGTSAVVLSSGILVSDNDNAALASASVEITGGLASGDMLTFLNTASITGSYSPLTGQLTLTSTGSTASLADWSAALSSITFSANASATPGNRTIAFSISDGTKTSVTQTHIVDVLGPPTVTTDTGSAAFAAGDNTASTPVAIDPGLTVTDGSASTLASATVSITGNFHSGEDALAFNNTDGTAFGNIAGVYTAGSGVLTLTSAGNSASLAQWQAALAAVTYTDTAVTPDNATRTISFTAADTGGITSNTATRTVTVADTDQTPIVKTTSGTTNYLPGSSAAAVDGGAKVTDLDSPTLASGSVAITTGFSTGDTLAFNNTDNTRFGDIAGSYDPATGALTLTSASVTATLAQWQAAFDAVTFSSTRSTFGTRTVSFTVNDGIKDSAAATKTVGVSNPAPVVTADPGSAAFTGGDNAAAAPVTVDAGVSVSDPGAPTLAEATVAITGNFHGGEDVLAFSNTGGAAFGNIAGSYDAASGVLTLTSAGNAATLAQWRAALDAVTYADTAVKPDTSTRTIGFSVIDINGSNSNTVTRTVTVTGTDQSPIVATTGGATSYTAGAAAVAVDGGVTVGDLDNATQASGSVAITGGFASGDALAFANSAAYGNIAASYNAETGVLTLTSAGATATDAQWASALDAVTFSASADAATGSRTISFAVNDGTKTSLAATKSVAVTAADEAPVVTGSGSASPYTDGGSPVTLAGVSVSDRDNTTLASATVSVAGGFVPGQEVLSFAGGAASGNIHGAYDAQTGVLTLTSGGGTATLAQWAAALNAVSFSEIGNAAPGARTLSITVSDGIKTSAPFSVKVDVNAATTTPTSPTTPGDQPAAVLTPPRQPAAPGATPSAPAVPPQVFDSSSNRPIVLAEFEPAPEVGATPVLPTITFTDSHAPARHLFLDRTSVTALPPDAALDPFASATPLFQPFQTTPIVLNYEIAPDQAFSVDLANLLPGVDGLRLSASSNLTVTLADGRPLPSWLHYDATKGTLTGTLPPGAAAVRIAVQERGADGSVIHNEVVLAPAAHHAHAQDKAHAAQVQQKPHATRGAPAPLAGRATGQVPLPAGKPSLAQQFARERASLHVVRPPAHALTAEAAATPPAAATVAPVAEHRA